MENFNKIGLKAFVFAINLLNYFLDSVDLNMVMSAKNSTLVFYDDFTVSIHNIGEKVKKKTGKDKLRCYYRAE